MKNLKSRLLALLLVSGSMIMTSNAQQETQTHQQKQSTKTPEERVDKKLGKMKTSLNLTDEQIPKVKEVLLARANMKETKAGKGNPDAAKIDRKQMMADLNKILTPEQMAKLNEMHETNKNQKNKTNPAKENESVK